MVKVINREALIEKRVKSNFATEAMVFSGSADQNLKDSKPVVYGDKILVPMKNGNWENSEGKIRLWNEIGELHKKINAAQAPSDDALTALLGKIFIDITRRAQEAPDMTSLIATEDTNLEFSETINMREIWPYRGKFKTISGSNDSVPLIEQALGEVDTVNMEIVALGWKDSLKNLLFNRLHSIEKVLQSVVSADTDYRNSKTVGVIVGATYVASQKQAADATEGATYDVKMYNTFRKAIKKIIGLKDIRTNRNIAVPSLAVLCNSADTWSIERVINGQLQSAGTGGALNSLNTSALPIAQIIEYNQGINDGFTWGKETLSFPGVTAGKCYLFVPREYFWVMNKRPLVMETGRGSVLQLSTEERAWYRAMTEYHKIFLGSSYPATTVGPGYGAVIEISLPTDT